MLHIRSLQRLLAFAPALLLATACVTTGDTPSPKRELPKSDWVLPSKSLTSDIETHAEALPWTHGRERVDLITWFAMVGEPAYDTLIMNLDDERPEVVATVLAALGATMDSRLVPHLRAAEHEDWSPALKMESARARVRLGDWEAMPALIDGLESPDRFKRALSAQALFEATREDKGYDPSASLPEREQAVERWRTWWQQRSNDNMLLSRAD